MPPQSLFHFQHQRKRIGITLIEEPTLIPIHSPLTSELIAIIKRTYTLDTIWSLISQEVLSFHFFGSHSFRIINFFHFVQLQLLIGYYIGIGTLSNCEDINKRSHTLQETSSQKVRDSTHTLLHPNSISLCLCSPVDDDDNQQIDCSYLIYLFV
jgi:hypothetical protein